MRHWAWSLLLACAPGALALVACSRTTLSPRPNGHYPEVGSAGGGGSGGDAGSAAGGANQGGANQGGANQGGANQGGANQGGDGGVGGAPQGVCGNGQVEDDEECDDGNAFEQDACLPSCHAARCGDGIVRLGTEACDDGNTVDGDGCQASCGLPGCGDSVVDPSEECDDGNMVATDACLPSCLKAHCGDGVVWQGVEGCDDGNASNTDACVENCKLAACGDGFIHSGVETCDDGNQTQTDACHNDCNLPECGDGIVDAGEQCDDGNGNNKDACRNSCVLPVCGDAIVDPGEQCDDANTNNGDECVLGCKKSKCGDGFLWNAVEECDDGNTASLDGCGPSCKVEQLCGNGKTDPGEQCDLGPNNQDIPALEIVQGALRKTVMPYDQPVDPAIFYNYTSASSHTGFEALGTSSIYFYRSTNSEVLSLMMHHGIDLNSSGQNQPSGKVSFTMIGLPIATAVALADDNTTELFKSSATTVASNWTFQSNTDGGVITSFPFPGDWTVTVTPTFASGITTWRFVNDDGSSTTLGLTQALQLFAHSQPSGCRKTCQLPACGDGYVDGGEVCDDGNKDGGDGCAANCKALND